MVPSKRETVFLFSYGANMAKQTLLRRDLNPIVTYPARILDDTIAIAFQHRSAFATLVKTQGSVSSELCKSKPFGVVHGLNFEDFQKVRERETGYKICKLKGVYLLETGEMIDCEAFVSSKWMLLPQPLPPTHRYKHLLVSGSSENHFVDFGGSEYVEWLSKVPSVESREISQDYSYTNTPSEKVARILGLFCMFYITSFIFLTGKR